MSAPAAPQLSFEALHVERSASTHDSMFSPQLNAQSETSTSHDRGRPRPKGEG